MLRLLLSLVIVLSCKTQSNPELGSHQDSVAQPELKGLQLVDQETLKNLFNSNSSPSKHSKERLIYKKFDGFSIWQIQDSYFVSTGNQKLGTLTFHKFDKNLNASELKDLKYKKSLVTPELLEDLRNYDKNIDSDFNKYNWDLSEIDLTADQVTERTHINLMWLNKDAESAKTMTYLYPETYKRMDEQIDLTERIKSWARLNPKTRITLWYDSDLVSDQALENTKNLFTDFENVEFKNIRDEFVGNFDHLKPFLSRELPSYFKTDIDRVAVSHIELQKALEQKKTLFSAYFDFSIDPISIQTVLNEYDTLEKINKLGFVFGVTEHASIENSFHLFANTKANLLKSIHTAIILRNLTRVKTLENRKARYGEDSPQVKESIRKMQQVVWEDYKPMVSYYYGLEGIATYETVEEQDWEKMTLGSEGEWKALSSEELSKIQPFNNLGDDNLSLRNKKTNMDFFKSLKMKSEIPTRPGISKPSHFHFGK